MDESMWLLDPAITYLNHGSFGACPRPVLEQQQALQVQLERQPVRFFLNEGSELLDRSRTELAAFVGADPDDLVLVRNATEGVNAVLRSLRWEAGDEVLLLNHTYNACRNVVMVLAERWGVVPVVAEIPFPLERSEQATEAILSAVTSRTRLALLDYVTSSTGLVLPMDTLVPALKARGVETLVDGAHTPGMLPLDLNALDAAYYTGNCHKWMCTPKGAAFLHVRRDKQDQIRPLGISHGANEPLRGRSRFQVEFAWTGTDDPTPRLCISHAIAWGNQVREGGWPAIMERNRSLALEARQLLCAALDLQPPAPTDMLGSLVTLPLPDAASRPSYSAFDYDPLQQALLRDYHIEVPIFLWPAPPTRWFRISAQLYNTIDDYQRLADALQQLLRRT